MAEELADDPRARWNARWRERREEIGAPDVWLLQIRPLLLPGTALDIGCGRGDNALYLAEEGWAVTAIDISEEAIAQLRHQAARRRLTIDTIRADLESSPRLPSGAFDLVLQFFYLHRPLFPALRNAVRPGGMIAIRTFSSAGPFSPPTVDPTFVFQPGELGGEFSGWEILIHEEGGEPSKKGGSLAGIVARKPG